MSTATTRADGPPITRYVHHAEELAEALAKTAIALRRQAHRGRQFRELAEAAETKLAAMLARGPAGVADDLRRQAQLPGQ